MHRDFKTGLPVGDEATDEFGYVTNQQGFALR